MEHMILVFKLKVKRMLTKRTTIKLQK